MLMVYKDFPAPRGSRCMQHGQYRDVFPWELSFRSQQRTLLRSHETASGSKHTATDRERAEIFPQKFEPGSLQDSLIKCGRLAFGFHHLCLAVCEQSLQASCEQDSRHKTLRCPGPVPQSLFKQRQVITSFRPE